MIISCGHNKISIHTVGDSEVQLIFTTSDPFVKPFQVCLNRSHVSALTQNLESLLSNWNINKEGREKTAVLRTIRTKLLEIYSEDEDVENELDCATDELTDAIEKLEEKYGK